MSRLTDERRDFIALWLGKTLLDFRKDGTLTLNTVKSAMDKADKWMAEQELREAVAKILEGGEDTKERLKELLK